MKDLKNISDSDIIEVAKLMGISDPNSEDVKPFIMLCIEKYKSESSEEKMDKKIRNYLKDKYFI